MHFHSQFKGVGTRSRANIMVANTIHGPVSSTAGITTIIDIELVAEHSARSFVAQ